MTEWGFSFSNAHLLPTWSLESNRIWELSIKNELELKRWNADMNESCTKWWKWRFFKCSFIFYSSQCGCAAARCLHLLHILRPSRKSDGVWIPKSLKFANAQLKASSDDSLSARIGEISSGCFENWNTQSLLLLFLPFEIVRARSLLILSLIFSLITSRKKKRARGLENPKCVKSSSNFWHKDKRSSHFASPNIRF